MKRNATDILRRGFNNALANWPLILIRIAEGIVFIGIVIAAIIAAVVPLVLSIGLSHKTWNEPGDAAEAILDAVAQHWIVLVYVVLIISAVLLVLIAIHSFVAAGCSLVYVDGERRNSAIADPPRYAYRSFTGERWMKGGADGWWTVFWIYNIAWGVAGLVMVAPLLVVLAAMFALRGSGPGAVIGAGCFGAVVSGMFLIAVAIVTNIWVAKAVVDRMARNSGAAESLRSSWREMRTDTARHLAVALVMMAVAFAGSMFLSSFTWMGSMGGHNPGFSLALMPMQFSASIAHTLFSSAVGSWFLASFAGLAIDSRP